MTSMSRDAVQPHLYAAVIAIGASGAEGLSDIKALLCALPHPLKAVVLVVLHRPIDRISRLRDILARSCPIRVAIAEEGERFEAGVCYIGEPAGHLTLAARNYAHLIDDPQNAYRNRTVDALFRSVAEHDGRRMIGVVLSGALDDGSRGLAAIKAAGGVTMVVTSPAGAKRGMPENARDFSAPIDKIGTPGEIAEEISRWLLRAD